MTKPMKLTEYLESLQPRAEVDVPFSVGDADRTVLLERPEDLQIAIVAVHALERLAGHDGVRMPLRDIRALRKRLTAAFKAHEVMTMEVEAYNALSWAAGLEVSEPPDTAATEHRGPDDHVAYDPNMSHLDLIQRAMAEEFDLDMTYYTQSRGQLNRRRITPLHVNAETYLHAYCHARREERVFRISRIGDIYPIDGLPVHKTAGPKRRGQGELDLNGSE